MVGLSSLSIIKSPEDFFTSEEIETFESEKELVVCVGMPGSGKSSYCHKNLKEHIHIEQDKIGTRAKVLKELDKSFLTGKSIVIDSTNPTQENRLEYYEKARKHNYNIKVLYFLVNGTGFNKLREKPVPDLRGRQRRYGRSVLSNTGRAGSEVRFLRWL
jgi:predicted kinase